MANDINTVTEIGRLTRDAELKYTNGGLAIANVSIAVNRSKKSGDQWVDDVSYFEVKIFGKTAENLNPYLKKGKQICVQGFLKQERWEKDGQRMSKVTIGAEQVQLIGGTNTTNDSGDGTSYATQQSDGSYGFYN